MQGVVDSTSVDNDKEATQPDLLHNSTSFGSSELVSEALL